MRTFVLVHGAWHGGWCWSRVRTLLEGAGGRVYTPTLTGLGDRAHLREPVPSLETHVGDILGLVQAEELKDIVLVGHSYGGMVISAVADRLGSRIKHLVYLDAAVPDDGADFASHVPGTLAGDIERRRAAFRAMAPDGIWLPPVPAEMVGVTNEHDVAWLQRRLTPHPLRTWLDPVRLVNGFEAIPKTYVLATRPLTNAMGYPAQAEIRRGMAGWTVQEIACGHDMMIIEPEQTAARLLEAGSV